MSNDNQPMTPAPAEAHITAIAFHVGSIRFDAHLCPITGQLRTTTPGRYKYLQTDTYAHQSALAMWNACVEAIKPKKKKRALASTRPTGA